MINGIDVSKYNTSLYPDMDILFCIIRAGYGKESAQIDPLFEKNYEEYHNKRKLFVGAYWFSYAVSVEEAIEEAKLCLSVINNRPLELPIAIDIEYDSLLWATKQGIALSKNAVDEMATAFCAYIEQHSGYKAMLYTNPDMMPYFTNTLNRYPLWLALWTKNMIQPPSDKYAWSIWQAGSVSKNKHIYDWNICQPEFLARLLAYQDMKDITRRYEQILRWY